MAEKKQSDPFTSVPNVAKLMKLMATRNQSLMKFYYQRMHQYELFYSRMIDDYVAQMDKMVGVYEEAREIEAETPLSYEGHLLQAQADAAQILEQAKAQAERILEEAYSRAGEAPLAASKQNGAKAGRRKSA